MKSIKSRLVLLAFALGILLAGCGSKEKCPAFTNIDTEQIIKG